MGRWNKMTLRAKRRFQFSLRSVLILTAAIAVAMAVWPLYERIVAPLAFVAFAAAPISIAAILGLTTTLVGAQRRWAIFFALLLLLSIPFLVDLEFARMLVFLALLIWTPQLGAIW